MIKRILSVVLCVFLSVAGLAQQVRISEGMHITKSIKVKAENYIIPAATSSAILIIEGNDIVIDFNHATIKSGADITVPDKFSGTAILIRNSRNVTIKNLIARGYKIALMASNVKGLRIENCDFSYNYRKRLNSTQEKEDLSDWMSYHQNENDEWLRYGAAMYLRGCDSAVIKDCIVTGGQNALMMMECNDGLIYNNDFSFNSGIGIGMYRSSRNNVMHNRLIFNVRGYSHGIYNRGQDSAGLLVYEQSNENMFYKNNATHGGDGFFLWAGQSTMETGKGGCNDNFIVSNDFSYAPTNGIEVTFSRNTILDNRIFGCDHGIWGGYSYDTEIRQNQFRNNRIAIAIEHGQRNGIYRNLFANDKEAIRLWSRVKQPDDWGYAKFRDTRSASHWIIANSFNNHDLVFNLSRTDSLNIFDNTISENTKKHYRIDSTVTNLDTIFLQSAYDRMEGSSDFQLYHAAEPKDPFAGSGKYAGRDKIKMTEWGPYDYRYPIIWHKNPVDRSDTLKFDLLGPEGKWKITAQTGLKVIGNTSGILPATVMAVKDDRGETNIDLQLEFTGSMGYYSQFGPWIKPKQTIPVRFRKYFKPMNWEVLFFSVDTSSHNPIRSGQLFSMYEKKAPVKIDTVNRLDYAWWGGVKAGANIYPQFLAIASASANFSRGRYELSVTWDDAVRIYVDDQLVLNEWEPGKYKFDESPNRKIQVQLGGDHAIRVEHVELGGFATLSLKLKPLD